MRKWAAIVVICTAAAAGSAAIYWQSLLISRLRAQLAAADAEKAQLRQRVDQLTRAQAGNPAVAPKPSSPRSSPADPGAAQTLSAAEAEQRAERLREALAQATAETERLQSRVSELQGQVESAAADNRRLSGAVDESKRSLTDAEQAVEKLRAELKANSARAAQLDALNMRLKEEAAAGKQSASQTQQIVSDLDGIFRRREMYLNNILRRYREITEQYRAMSGVIGSRDREAATVGSTEISRIQNSIALAEEDLKQITALNAQASRLEKRLHQ